jgi:CheY-like chemotaxis protein
VTRILVVDDDPALREALRSFLVGEDYVVQEATSGTAALAHYRREPSDLVITDLLMPDMEGLELIRALRRHNPAVKIIAMSGGSAGIAANYLKVAMKFGAGWGLAKPFSRQEFLDTVAAAMADPPISPTI